jgi:polyvinyl alcohol dehydrogenase (cytochrome)
LRAVSSWEEFSAVSLDYPCCTSRGSVVAFEASTGKSTLENVLVPEDPQPGKTPRGAALGAGWRIGLERPDVDPRRGVIYSDRRRDDGAGGKTSMPSWRST